MPKFIYNAIDKQEKKHANELTIKEWNDIINILTTQSNASTEYTELVHRWLVGDGNELPDLKGKSLFEYIATAVPSGGGNSSGGAVKLIEGILTEDDIISLWNLYEKGDYKNGFYIITSQMYGKEMIIMTRQLVIEGEVDEFGNPKDARLFKRITGEYDYTYDFKLEQWKVSSGGGGGGTGSGNVVIIARNPEQTVATTSDNTVINFFFRPSTGKTGTYTIYVNGAFKQSGSVESGERTLPISKDWLTTGTNEVVLKITDNATNKGEVAFYIEGVTLGLRSNFIEAASYTGIFEFSYTPSGAVNKTLYLYIDKGTPNEIKIEKELSSLQSDTVLTERFTELTHGLHTIYVIMKAYVKTELITSNVLSYNLVYYTSTGTDTIISSKFNTTSAKQGQLLSIDYFVYNPENDRPTVSLSINNELIKEQIFKGIKDSFDITNYPYGKAIKFTLQSGNATKDFFIDIEESEIKIDTIREGLALELTAFGRSNNEGSNRDKWAYKDITAVLSDFNWGSNGWVTVNNETCLRLNGKADVFIPYNIFEKDISINGLTIEIEYSSRDVYDINKVLLNCFSNNRGIIITPNEASFKSELSYIRTKFKEDEKIKISFIVQPNNASSLRLIKTFINGVFSGVIQYDVNDNFKQVIPEGITINANDGAIDIYTIRVYEFALTDTQVLNNYIADMPLEHRISYYNKNNIIENGVIKYALVKPLIPTLTVTGPLPLTKGDKKNVSVTYEVPSDFIGTCGYNFTEDNVTMDIQGTSSVAYPRKNYKFKFSEAFPFYEGAIPEKVYTMKADYMESSHSHNTGNGILMTKFSPMFPTQTADNGVRNSIYGFPIVIFHKETNESLPVYYGVFNFNNDKGNSNTLGLTTANAESWEFKDNALPLCVFDVKNGVTNFSNYFEENKTSAFEARYPDGHTNYNNLKRVINWVYSTKFNLSKFETEFEQYFNKEFCLFYYVMMDVILAVDSRAKNMFLDTLDGTIWYPRWYDMDTSYGLDNVGYNKYSYGLEQEDYIDENNNIIDPEVQTGSPVYGGVASVLWNNFGKAFPDEIKEYYNFLRSDKKLSYDTILEIIKGHQVDKISAAMYNTDGDFKYIGPLIEDNDVENLYIAQGSRVNHLQWWLKNRFNYLDSKYRTPEFIDDTITMRVYKVSNPAVANTFDYTLTPYVDSYCLIRYGNDVWKEQRSKANRETLIEANADFDPQNGQEVYIYNASNLLSIGDLSGKYAARMDFTRAKKLKELIIGNSTPGYYNDKLTELNIGNLPMLERLNIENCSKLKNPIDLSTCLNIKHVYARGTILTAITFADGGNLETLELPETIASIKLLNQPFLSTFIMDGADKNYQNLNTLWIENAPGIDTRPIISSARNLNRLRLVGINWTLANFEQDILIYLTSGNLLGIDANGKDLPKPYINGKIHILGTVAQRQLDEWNNYFKEFGLTVTAETPSPSYKVDFLNWDGTLLQTKYVLPGATAEYTGETPTKAPTNGYFNVFIGWDKPLTNIQENTVVTAEFRTDKPSRLVLSLDSIDYLKPTIRVGNFTGKIVVDWGDNTPIETFIVENNNSYYNYYDMTHIYSTTGNYIIEVLLQGSRNKQTYNYDLATNNTSSSEWHCDISLWNTGEGLGSYYSSRLIECELQEGIYDRLHPMLLRLSQISTFTVPSSIDFIGGSASINTNNESASYDSGYTNVFYNCPNLTKVTILNPKTKIGAVYSGYASCPLLKSVILSGVTEENYIYIPNDTINLPDYYIKSCASVEHIILPENLVNIGRGNFYGLISLANIDIPDTVEKISDDVGNYCTLFTTITLPANLKQLGRAFSYNSKLTTIYYHNNLLNWCNIDFSDPIVSSSRTIYLCRKIYNETTGELISEEYYTPETIIIPQEVVTIKKYQFASWTKLKKCVLHENVRYIKENAFIGCVLLEDINITDDIHEIKDRAFYGCKKLTSVKIPINITEISSYCFSECTLLKDIVLPPNLITISDGAFYNTAVSNLILPETVKKIGSYAFEDSQIESINLPNSIETLGYSAFEDCSKLTTLTIPNKITEIPSSFCSRCTSLYEVVLHDNIVKINSNAFYGCSNLIDIVLPSSLEFIDYHGLYCGAYNKTNITFTSTTPPEIYGLDSSSHSLPPLTYINIIKVLAGYVDVYKTYTSYMDYSSKIIDKGVGFGPIGIQWLLLNSSNDIEIPFGNDTGATPTFTISSSDTSILNVGALEVNPENPGYAKFTAVSHNIEGSVEITATITADGTTATTKFKVDVYNETPINSYEVNAVFGTPYSFELNLNNYYESKNKGINSSYAICRVDIFSYGNQTMYVDCISYGENYTDYGILSKLNTKLTNSNADDTTLTNENTGTAKNVYKTFKGLSSPNVQTVNYGVLDKGNYYLFIKYRKDPSQNQYLDTLQFKIRFEK